MRKALLPLTASILTVLSAQAWADSEPSVTLDTMNVSIDRQGAKSKTNVITTTSKNERTETDLRGLLNEEPAINFGGGNGTSQWWTIRGMGQSQIDLKVDNTYTDSQIFHHQGRFMLDPSLVKIVEVQKGAGSASAGIGATSGAIIAKTLDAKELLQNSTNENFGAKLNAGYSSNKGYNYGVAVFGKAGAIDALIAGNWVDNSDYKGGDGYINAEGSNVVKNSALDQRGLLAKVGIDVGDNHRFVISHRDELNKGVRALREEFDFSQARLSAARLSAAQVAAGYVLTDEFAGVGRGGVNTYYIKDADGNYISNDANNSPSYREISTKTTNLEWSAKNLGFVDKLDANAYTMELAGKFTPDAHPRVHDTSKAKIRGANINLDSQLHEDVLLKYGVNYRYQKNDPDRFDVGTTNQEKTDWGVYAESIADIGNLTATAGMRYDHFDFTPSIIGENSVKHGRLNPSVGLIYQITPALSVSTNHNHASRSPRLEEVALGWVATGIADNIKPEHAKNTEVGFNYNDGKFSANGSYFWQKVENAFGYNGDDLVNAGYLKNKGYELGLGYRHGGLSARLGMAYSEPEVYGDVADGTQLAIAMGRTYTGSLGYQLANYPVEFGWRGRLVDDSTGCPSRGSGGACGTVDGYNVHDFYANWKPYGNDKMNVNFAINNAFDKNYKPHSQRAGVASLPGVGRDLRVGVNFTY